MLSLGASKQVVSRYRWKMELWDLTLDPVYVDDNYYAFRRGTSFLAVVTNGQHGSTIALPLTSMEPGVKLCNVMPPHVRRACKAMSLALACDLLRLSQLELRVMFDIVGNTVNVCAVLWGNNV